MQGEQNPVCFKALCLITNVIMERKGGCSP